MRTDEHAGGSRSEELGVEECWDLLASTSVGRLVWSGGEGLTVATVAYAVDDGTVVFRTVPYGAIARECDDHPVAFHADRADEATRTGWSVLVRGRAQLERGDDVPLDTVVGWPDGSRVLPVRVVPHRVTGRRLVLR